MESEVMAAQPNEVASELVDPVSKQTEVALLDPLVRIEMTLNALAVASKAANWDVDTTAGEKAAREFRARCVRVRTDADEAYETGNKPLLKAQRKARDLVQQIKAFVAPIESEWDAKIKAREKRREDERREREHQERLRIAAIRGRIDAIGAMVISVAHGSAADIEEQLHRFAEPLNEQDFEELLDEANGALLRARAQLTELHSKAVAHEAEAVRLAEERAEIERQQAALDAERAALEQGRAEQAAAEAKERAEQALRRREEDAERERAAVEHRRQVDAFEAEKKAESDRMLAERRRAEEKAKSDLDAQEAAHEALQSARADESAVKPVAMPIVAPVHSTIVGMDVVEERYRPSDEEILAAVADHFLVFEHEALEWFHDFDVAAQHARLVVAGSRR